MSAPLIRGCVNAIIKKQLIEAVDGGCRDTDCSDPICTVFKSQLEALPECSEYHEEPRKERKPSGPKRMTDYQKHMSVCRKSEVGFDECIRRWNARDEEGNYDQRMHTSYQGSEFTKTRIK